MFGGQVKLLPAEVQKLGSDSNSGQFCCRITTLSHRNWTLTPFSGVTRLQKLDYSSCFQFKQTNLFMAFIAKGLQIFGALALAALLAIIGFFTYAFYSNTDRTDIASKKETRFIFTNSGLKTDQEYKVIRSFESARSLSGDHQDNFCIQLTALNLDASRRNYWKLVSELSRPEQEAVSRTESSEEAVECFKRAKSEFKNFQVNALSVYLSNGFVTSYEVILFDSQTNRLFYKSYKS
jgi:hypothetical protein